MCCSYSTRVFKVKTSEITWLIWPQRWDWPTFLHIAVRTTGKWHGQYSPVILYMGIPKWARIPVTPPPVPSGDPTPLWLIHPPGPPTTKKLFLPEKPSIVRMRHLLDMRHKTLHFPARLSVSPLVALPASLITLCHSLATPSPLFFFRCLVASNRALPLGFCRFFWFSWSPFDMEIKWLHSMSE